MPAGRRAARVRLALLLAAGAAMVAACGSAPATPPTPTDSASGLVTLPPASGSPSAPPTVVDPSHAVAPPGPMTQSLAGADLLVSQPAAFSPEQLADLAHAAGVDDTDVVGMGSVGIQNRVITVAAVDPASYRRFTPQGSAQLEEVWDRVAGGELALTPTLSRQLRRLIDQDGYLRLGNDITAPDVHIGAVAEQAPRIDAVVNDAWAADLGLPEGNAVLVWTGESSPQSVRPALEKIAGPNASVQILGPDLDISVQQTAFLTGGSVASGVGSFSYRVLDGGRIAPDPAWVRANIRTEQVPILGAVTCHRILFPQLRAALTEIVQRGLADKIHPGEYAGCYNPRFIAGTTQLSLHAFGIALDLNVPGNQRGTVGEIDRNVVRIFQKWGFTWGGDWAWTDPMHFEMNAIVTPR
jgi:D-alanyl-D-alanine carboxypeptidase